MEQPKLFKPFVCMLMTNYVKFRKRFSGVTTFYNLADA
jgi:hypothetical protein